jgi:hypothetical protein
MREHLRPALEYISQRIQDGDSIYVYNANIAPFRFYQEYFDFENYVIINGESPRNQKRFENQLHSLNGRIWLVFSHMSFPESIKYIYEEVDKHRTIDQFEGINAKTTLVEFDTSNVD